VVRDRYFDNAATTPLDPRVLQEMMPFLEDGFGNAHSIHAHGQRAIAAVEQARERVAMLLGAEDPAQVTFTSGATEANNWVLANFSEGAVGPFEHSAILEPARRSGLQILANCGVQICPPDSPLPFLSVMSANNELGTLWHPQQFRASAEVLHSDMTQSVGKLPTDLEGIDYASLSAHKFYGPKGIGALYTAEQPLPPLLVGGDQENGLRAGTLNVSAIVGLGAAAAVALDTMEEDARHALEMRAAVVEGLEGVADWRVNGGEEVSPYVLSISFLGIEGESLVVELDRAGYAISSGAACSSRSAEPSHVLTSLGLDPEWLRGTVRVSFGRFNTLHASEELARVLLTSVEKLRTMGRRAGKRAT